MSTDLDHSRARFEATPRELQDDELIRIARGDRGCLADIVSAFAAVLLVTAAIFGAMGRISFTWTYVAAAFWIGGFVWGTVAQTRSGKLRKAALENGALVMAVVLDCEAWLRRPGTRVGRAVVVLSTDPDRRFDREWLDALAAAIEASKSANAGSEWAKLLDDPDAFGVVALDPNAAPLAALDDPEGGAGSHVAAMHVHPERLEGGYLGYAEDREAGERGLDFDAPTRAPIVVAIVDPERAFIEQVPRAHGQLEDGHHGDDGDDGDD